MKPDRRSVIERNYRPEQRLVIQAVRSELGDRDYVSEATGPDIDWEGTIQTADKHGVSQLLYRAFDEHCRESVPSDVMADLRTRYETTTRTNLMYTQELFDLVEVIRDQDIQVIPYRGPVLASIAYGNIALRQFGDLDLFVNQDDIPAVKSLLLNEGYNPRYWYSSTEDLSPAQERAYTSFCRDYPFRRENGLEVELHWRVISRHFPTEITLDTVWNRRVKTSINGRELAVLSTEDRLLMLCVHGSRHKWERFSWIVDVGQFINRHDVNWDDVWQRASEQNCKRMVALGPLLAHDLFGTELPGHVSQFIETDNKTNVLRAKWHQLLFESPNQGRFESRLEQVEMLDRKRDVVHFWLWWAFSPDRPSLERVALPDSMVGLYRLVRMARLSGLAGRRAKRTVRGFFGDSG